MHRFWRGNGVCRRLQGDGGGRRKRKAEAAEAAEKPQKLVVESYAPADPGPYPEDLPPQNPVRFTPMQVASWLSCFYSASACATGTCTPGCCRFRSLQSLAHVAMARLHRMQGRAWVQPSPSMSCTTRFCGG